MIWAADAKPPPSPFYAQFFGDQFNRLWAVAARLDDVLQGNLKITSWHRDAERNRRAGGDPFSQHLLGTGLDVSGSPVGVSSELLLSVAERIAPQFGIRALRNEGYTHVHLQAFEPGVSQAIIGLIPWLKWTGTPALTSTRVPAASRVTRGTLTRRV